MNKHRLWRKGMLAGIFSFSLMVGWNTCLATAAGNVPDVEWEKTFDQIPGEAQQTKDGGYIFIGEPRYSQPNSFVKTDAQGKVEWAKPIIGQSVWQTKDGGYIIGLGDGNKIHPTFILHKTNASGEIQWSSELDGSQIKNIKEIRETSDEGYIFIGYQTIVKVDRDGKLIWRKDSDAFYNLSSVEQTADGGYILGGGDFTNLRLWKLDESGNAIWSKKYLNSGKNDAGAGYAVQTSDGGYAIAGNQDGRLILIKTDAAGAEQWSKTYGGNPGEKLASLQISGDGGYLLGGYFTTRKLNNSELHDNFVVKTNSSGIEKWSKTIGNSENENVDALMKQAIPTSDGGAAIFGWKVRYTPDGVFQNGLAQLLKLSPNATTPETGLSLDSADYSVSVGQMVDTVLTAVYGGKKVNATPYGAYQVADPTIANVDAAGNITGLKYGQTVLTSTYNSMTAKANIYVYGKSQPPSNPELRLDSEDYSLSVGQKLDTVLTVVKDGKKTIITGQGSYSIADPSVASVDSAGIVTGLKRGVTVLTITYNGMKATASVYVY